MKTKTKYGHLIKWLFSIVDIAVLNLSYLLAILIIGDEMNGNIRLITLAINFSYILVLYFNIKIHDRRVIYADHVAMESLKSSTIHAGVFLPVILFLGLSLPLKGIILFYVIFSVGLMLWWLLSRKILKIYRNRGYNYRKIVVVGSGFAMRRFIEEITGDQGYGYKIIGIFGGIKGEFDNYHKDELDELENFVSQNEIDEIYCAMPDIDGKKVSEIVKLADDNAIDFYYIPQLGPKVTRNFSLVTFGNVPVLSVRPNPSQSTINRIIKRTFDIIASLIGMIFFPIVLIPVAIAIKCTSKGPLFFKQLRTGYRGKEFYCYKFRTMKFEHNSDNLQVTRNDPSVTRVGRFLRHYSIDELPQLFNVLKGDMSIVGPRPHMVEHTEMYKNIVDKYMVRHIVKPGITGWAQVCGYRGQTDELWKMEKRVECDVWYAENWNFLLDLKIIFLTIYNAIRGEKNAF